MISKDLGAVSAYGMALDGGLDPEISKQEYAELLASYGTVAQEAGESADQAAQAANAAGQLYGQTATARDAAISAKEDAESAQAAAAQAANVAGRYEAQAETAKTDAESARDTAVDAVDGFAAGAQQALDSVNEAGGNWKSLAEKQAGNSEAWAVGQRGGEDVPTTDVAYHNNAKYYAEQAATDRTTAQTAATNASQSATAAAESASAAAESARTLTIDNTLTQSGQAADAKVVGKAIGDLFKITPLSYSGFTPLNGYIDTNGSWINDSSVTSYIIPIEKNCKKISLMANDVSNSNYAFLKNNVVHGYQQMAFCDGTQRYKLMPGESAVNDIPNDCNYIYILHTFRGVENWPETIDLVINNMALVVGEKQELTDDEKNIVRDNIGAVSKSIISGRGAEYSFELGGVDKVNGAIVNSQTRVRTGLINITTDIVPLLEFTCNIDTANYTFKHIVFYQDGTFVKSLTSGYDPALSIFQLDGTFNQFRASFGKNDDSAFTQEEVNEFVLTIMYGASISDLYDRINSGLTGKKYVALGDSITWGYAPRNCAEYGTQIDSYAKLAANKLGMSFENYGIVGSTIAYHATRNPMSVRYTELPDDADIITVMGGTNDIRNGIQLGTLSDRDNTTFYGALHVLLGGLYKKYYIDQTPSEGREKKIIVCTPIKLLLQSASELGGTGTLYDFEPWVNAVKDVAAYYSFPVLDFYNLSGINPHLNETVQGTVEGYTGVYNPYITDGTHPTKEGQQMMADVLCGFLKTLA